jgi:hypothetical protein
MHEALWLKYTSYKSRVSVWTNGNDQSWTPAGINEHRKAVECGIESWAKIVKSKLWSAASYKVTYQVGKILWPAYSILYIMLDTISQVVVTWWREVQHTGQSVTYGQSFQEHIVRHSPDAFSAGKQLTFLGKSKKLFSGVCLDVWRVNGG